MAIKDKDVEIAYLRRELRTAIAKLQNESIECGEALGKNKRLMQGETVSDVQRGLDAVSALLDAMETCHICHGEISLADVTPTHCEDCSWDCDAHDEPECESIFWLHHKAKIALKSLHERMSDLGRLRAATNDAIAAVSSSAQKPSGPVNWGDLHCRQASWVITDDGSEYPEVLIEEASPDAAGFQSAVTAKLERSGWPGVNVVTAW